jgi:plastocyanin
VVNPDNSLKWVFVYVSRGLEGVNYPAPTEKKVLDQRSCVYEPHVWGMMAGQPLQIINSDETLHNVHAIPKDPGNAAFNLAMPFKDQKFEKTFAASEVMIPVKCEVHPWMHAYIGVLAHPVYSVTGDDGTFRLHPLPPGTYTVTAWHEVYGTQEQEATVGPSETKDISFTFTAAAATP